MSRPIRELCPFAKINIWFAKFKVRFVNGKNFCEHAGYLAWLQFLPGHAAIGSYLRDKIHRIDSNRRWRCDTGERQSRFLLVARCPAWAGQARVM